MLTMSTQLEFRDIAPFDNDEFESKISELVKEPGFEHAVKYVMPDVDYSEFVEKLKSIKDKTSFQLNVMVPFLVMLEKKTTDGISFGGFENVDHDTCYTYLSNHRDIVLDASFLNLCLVRNGLPTSEVAIGSNLLIFDWITNLVKINKSFIVKRNLQRTKALEAAMQLSAYIHYAINEKHESLWIAQREGRAKDSNDVTQESLAKMLALSGGGSFIENIKAINIMPVSISYEYDPNDYLKAREFLLRKLDPEFKKSQHDDLLSMETGLLQNKGRVHFQLGPCINEALGSLPSDMPRLDAVKDVCHIIDSTIHSGYKIYPINYIAFDKLHKTDRFRDRYDDRQIADVEAYINRQLEKVDIPDLSTLDVDYMREMMYVMYANPLRNKIAAEERCSVG